MVRETVRQRCRANVVLDRYEYTVRLKKVWRRIYTNRIVSGSCSRERIV